ncbi:hypothetical protein EYF80_012160 [Liparis tanakae]|uniref:Uncharacterized protein n=1 Tax=Liparis tanakae TaxID=230148 RepID=A0A4Z2IHW2_9TELE|nr:hypothetical protein EYF80_012160 [Liparis tanakae]
MPAGADEPTVNVSSEDPPPKPKSWAERSPGQLQSDESFGLGFYALPPKLEFGVDGAVEDEILVEALGVEGADRRVTTNTTVHPPEEKRCVLTMPMHFFRMLQMLTSFLENMGVGRDVLQESSRGGFSRHDRGQQRRGLHSGTNGERRIVYFASALVLATSKEFFKRSSTTGLKAEV